MFFNLMCINAKDTTSTTNHIRDAAGIGHRVGGHGEGGVHPVLI